MWRIAFPGWIVAFLIAPLWAQSVVFLSPSTQAQLNLACSAGSLDSFEEIHYLAVAHFLADRLCTRPEIAGAVGLWQGQAENSGMIDGCSNDKARALGALLGKYYHQKAALVFTRGGEGKMWLVSFRTTRSLRVISARMASSKVNGATVIPRAGDSLILMVATNEEQRAKAYRLCSLLHGREFKQEAGTAELIGDPDRAKARTLYNDLLAHAPAEVQDLDHAMYSEAFSNLGMERAP